ILPSWHGLLKPITSHLAPAALGALVCLLFFELSRQHGIGLRTSSWATLFLGVGTSIWVYARYPYTEILQTACFTGFYASLLRACRAPNNRAGWRLGAWAGLLFNAKTVFALSVITGALYLVWRLRNQRPHLLAVLTRAAIALLPAIAV